MATKPYRVLGMELQPSVELERRRAAESLIKVGRLQEEMANAGRDLGRKVRRRLQAK